MRCQFIGKRIARFDVLHPQGNHQELITAGERQFFLDFRRRIGILGKNYHENLGGSEGSGYQLLIVFPDAHIAKRYPARETMRLEKGYYPFDMASIW